MLLHLMLNYVIAPSQLLCIRFRVYCKQFRNLNYFMVLQIEKFRRYQGPQRTNQVFDYQSLIKTIKIKYTSTSSIGICNNFCYGTTILNNNSYRTRVLGFVLS